MTAAVPVSTEPRARSAPRFPLTGSATRQGCGARQWKTWSRFIPACAGNTAPRHDGQRHKTVHPRVCGEHFEMNGGRSPLRGSSPRVRGTREWRGRCRPRRRFIPACAGNTTRSWRHFTQTSVHPRVCGEHVTEYPDGYIRVGSSPRVRGTQHETGAPR